MILKFWLEKLIVISVIILLYFVFYFLWPGYPLVFTHYAFANSYDSLLFFYYYYYFLIKQRHVRLNLWSRRGDLGCRGRWHWELGHSLGVSGWEKGKQNIVTPNGHKDSDPKKYEEYGTLASTWKWLSAQLALVVFILLISITKNR